MRRNNRNGILSRYTHYTLLLAVLDCTLLLTWCVLGVSRMYRYILYVDIQVDTMVVNRYFGRGVPDYDSLGEKRGKWSVQVEGDG